MTEPLSRLVFSWLGSSVPSYAQQSLALNLKYSRSKLYLVTDEYNVNLIQRTWSASLLEKLTLLRVSDFYSQPQQLQHLVYFGPNDFESGFWIRTFERFFLLQSLLKSELIGSFFHAELDNICFNLPDLKHSLDSHTSSAFFVRDNIQRAVLSLSYFSRPDALDALIAFLEGLQPGHTHNDMHDLGYFLNNAPPGVSSLPNETTCLEAHPWKMLNHQTIGGICDANSLGQYILGLDTTISETFVNLFKNENLLIPISDYNFCLVNGSLHHSTGHAAVMPALKTRHPKNVFPIYNLHIHSKVFFWLRSPLLIRVLFSLVNRSIPIPVFTTQKLLRRLKRRSSNLIRSIIS